MTQPNDQFQHPAGSIEGQKERRAAFLQRQRDAQKAFQQRIANAKGKSSRATTGDAGDNVEDLMAKRPVSPLPNPREQELQREIDLLKQNVAALSGQVRRMIPPQGLRELRPRIFPMTSDDDFATATEKLLSGDALIDHPGGRVFTIVDTSDLADSLGFGYEMVDTQDGHVKVVVIQGGGGGSPPSGIIGEIVFLVQNGGAAGGDQTASCSYAYDVKRATDHSVVYGTAVNVTQLDGTTDAKIRFRGLKVQCTAGTVGFAMIDYTDPETPVCSALVAVFDEHPVHEDDCVE